MATDSPERRIAEALHTLVDNWLAPYMAGQLERQNQSDIYESSLTKDQVAKILTLSKRTVEREIELGRILAHGPKGSVRIDPCEVDRYKRLKKEEG